MRTGNNHLVGIESNRIKLLRASQSFLFSVFLSLFIFYTRKNKLRSEKVNQKSTRSKHFIHKMIQTESVNLLISKKSLKRPNFLSQNEFKLAYGSTKFLYKNALFTFL